MRTGRMARVSPHPTRQQGSHNTPQPLQQPPNTPPASWQRALHLLTLGGCFRDCVEPCRRGWTTCGASAFANSSTLQPEQSPGAPQRRAQVDLRYVRGQGTLSRCVGYPEGRAHLVTTVKGCRASRSFVIRSLAARNGSMAHVVNTVRVSCTAKLHDTKLRSVKREQGAPSKYAGFREGRANVMYTVQGCDVLHSRTHLVNNVEGRRVLLGALEVLERRLARVGHSRFLPLLQLLRLPGDNPFAHIKL